MSVNALIRTGNFRRLASISFLIFALTLGVSASPIYQKLKTWNCKPGSIELFLMVDSGVESEQIRSYLSIRIQDHDHGERRGYLGDFASLAEAILQAWKNSDSEFPKKAISGRFFLEFRSDGVGIRGKGWEDEIFLPWKEAVNFAIALQTAKTIADDGLQKNRIEAKDVFFTRLRRRIMELGDEKGYRKKGKREKGSGKAPG